MGDGIRSAEARCVQVRGPSERAGRAERVEWLEFAVRLRMDDGIRLA